MEEGRSLLLGFCAPISLPIVKLLIRQFFHRRDGEGNHHHKREFLSAERLPRDPKPPWPRRKDSVSGKPLLDSYKVRASLPGSERLLESGMVSSVRPGQFVGICRPSALHGFCLQIAELARARELIGWIGPCVPGLGIPSLHQALAPRAVGPGHLESGCFVDCLAGPLQFLRACIGVYGSFRTAGRCRKHCGDGMTGLAQAFVWVGPFLMGTSRSMSFILQICHDTLFASSGPRGRPFDDLLRQPQTQFQGDRRAADSQE